MEEEKEELEELRERYSKLRDKAMNKKANGSNKSKNSSEDSMIQDLRSCPDESSEDDDEEEDQVTFRDFIINRLFHSNMLLKFLIILFLQGHANLLVLKLSVSLILNRSLSLLL